MKSPKDKGPRQVRFLNRSDQPVKIYWLDYEGKRMPWSQSTVSAGSSRVCHTSYAGHAWLFTDKDDKGLGIYVLGKDTTEVRFTEAIK